MKKLMYSWALPVILVLSGLVGLYILVPETSVDRDINPPPTNGFETIVREGSEDENNGINREAWFNNMHRHAPGTDWRAMEYQNSLMLNKKRQDRLSNLRSGDLEILADGKLTGYWNERGSLNQSGSVFDTEYSPEEDKIYTISAGGVLWKGKRDGSSWEVIHQNLQFNHGLLKFVPHNGGKRLITFIGRIPHYSDDLGETWTAAEGWMNYADSWGTFSYPLLSSDSLFVYALAKPSYWDPWVLYKSEDLAETFYPIQTLETHDYNDWALSEPHGSGTIILTRRKPSETLFYEIDQSADTLILINSTSTFKFKDRRANLAGAVSDTVEKWYAYSNFEGFNGFYQSIDQGKSWVLQSELSESPWDVGVFVSPSAPENVYYGGVECFRSPNEGKDWIKINNWGAYYSSPATTIHADIMHFSEFTDPNGKAAILKSA